MSLLVSLVMNVDLLSCVGKEIYLSLVVLRNTSVCIEEVVWAVSSCLTEVDLRITLNRRSKWLNELLNEYGHILWNMGVLTSMLMMDMYDVFYTWIVKLY